MSYAENSKLDESEAEFQLDSHSGSESEQWENDQEREEYELVRSYTNMTKKEYKALEDYKRQDLIAEYQEQRKAEADREGLKNKRRGGAKGNDDSKKQEQSSRKSTSSKKKMVHKTAKRVYSESEEGNSVEEDDNDNYDDTDDDYDESKKRMKKQQSKKKKMTKSDDQENEKKEGHDKKSRNKESEEKLYIDLNDLDMLCIKREQILSLLQYFFFRDILRTSYVLYKSDYDGKLHYKVGKVNDVRTESTSYEVDGIFTNKILVLENGSEIDIAAVSNGEIRNEDYKTLVDECKYEKISLLTKEKCKQMLADRAMFMEKVPTEKDISTRVTQLQMTSDIRSINLLRAHDDLVIAQDKLRTEKRLVEEQLDKAKSSRTTTLHDNLTSLRKELAQVDRRLESLRMELDSRGQATRKRDNTMKALAATNQRRNQEMASKHRKQIENAMSRQPTMPSVSWETRDKTVQNDEQNAEQTTTPSEKQEKEMTNTADMTNCQTQTEGVKKLVSRVSVENVHNFDFTLNLPTSNAIQTEDDKQKKPRVRKGISLNQYYQEYNTSSNLNDNASSW